MTDRPFPIPSWAPPAAAAALVVWAASIWWMVATLDTGADTGTIEEGLSVIAEELQAANSEIDTLAEQVTALQAERDALVARVEELEEREPLSAAFEMSPAEDAEGAEGADAEAGDASLSPFFTDGQDRYNCRDFASHEEAQEALEVNGPGDPNRIDTNRNGIACEDFKYRAGAVPTP